MNRKTLVYVIATIVVLTAVVYCALTWPVWTASIFALFLIAVRFKEYFIEEGGWIDKRLQKKFERENDGERLYQLFQEQSTKEQLYGKTEDLLGSDDKRSINSVLENNRVFGFLDRLRHTNSLDLWISRLNLGLVVAVIGLLLYVGENYFYVVLGAAVVILGFIFFGGLFSILSSSVFGNFGKKLPAAIVTLIFVLFGWAQTWLTIGMTNQVAKSYAKAEFGKIPVYVAGEEEENRRLPFFKVWDSNSNPPSQTSSGVESSNRSGADARETEVEESVAALKKFLVKRCALDEKKQVNPILDAIREGKVNVDPEGLKNIIVEFDSPSSPASPLDRRMANLTGFPLKIVASEESQLNEFFDVDVLNDKKLGPAFKTYLGEFYRELRTMIPLQVIRWCNGWIQALTFMAFWLGAFLLFRDFLEHVTVGQTWKKDLLEFKVWKDERPAYPDGYKIGDNKVGGQYRPNVFFAKDIRQFAKLKDNPDGNEVATFLKSYQSILNPTPERLATRFSVRAMNAVCHVYAGLPRASESLEAEGAFDKVSTFASLGAVREAWIHRLENGKSMITYFAWAIPSIGFLGTVLGMGVALGKAGGMLSDSEVKQKEVIDAVTADLGAAFDTTLIAIAVSLVLMIFIYWIRQMQEDLVYRIEDEIRDHVIPRFRPPPIAPTGAPDSANKQ